MDWFAAMVTRANANSGVTTLLGGAKVYSEDAPQPATRPFVTLLHAAGSRPDTLNAPDLEFARVQIDVYTDTYAAKNPIMEAVITALQPGGTYSGHIFQHAEISIAPHDVGGERANGQKVYRKMAELTIAHKPA